MISYTRAEKLVKIKKLAKAIRKAYAEAEAEGKDDSFKMGLLRSYYAVAKDWHDTRYWFQSNLPKITSK